MIADVHIHGHPVLDAVAAPSLPASLGQVVFELKALDLRAMNEV